jgi:hypothetical protein
MGTFRIFKCPCHQRKKIDDILIAAISKMSTWKPAEFSNGLKVKQDYILTVGNMENSMVSLLNIRPIE